MSAAVDDGPDDNANDGQDPDDAERSLRMMGQNAAVLRSGKPQGAASWDEARDGLPYAFILEKVSKQAFTPDNRELPPGLPALPATPGKEKGNVSLS